MVVFLFLEAIFLDLDPFKEPDLEYVSLGHIPLEFSLDQVDGVLSGYRPMVVEVAETMDLAWLVVLLWVGAVRNRSMRPFAVWIYLHFLRTPMHCPSVIG